MTTKSGRLTDEDLAKIIDRLEAVDGADSVSIYNIINVNVVASRSSAPRVYEVENEIFDEFCDDDNSFDFSVFYTD